MGIYSIANKLKTPIMSLLFASVPMKTAKNFVVPIERNAFNKTTITVAKDITYGLKKERVVNFKGGVIERFDSASIETLKQRIAADTSKVIRYCFPLKDAKKPYTEPFGHFLADRPGGRKHLGLDIFVTPYARKPKEPVTIVAPIDGIVVSNKFARPEDNVIANSISILGVDGRKYAFDHMARGTEYADSIVRPKVGQKVKMGTPLGYVGSTGETSLYHLHLVVMTDKQLAAQKQSKMWLDMAKHSEYSSLCGQVNPLNKKDAGEIADVLNDVLK